MTSRGNATSCPLFRRLPLALWTEPEKLTFVVFREREQQSMNHFNLHAASKLKFLILYVHTASRQKLNRNEWVMETRKGKTGSSNFSSLLRRRSQPSCVRGPMLPGWYVDTADENISACRPRKHGSDCLIHRGEATAKWSGFRTSESRIYALPQSHRHASMFTFLN